jgi:N-acetyl-1-D-myo-inositol-2-amino-2-deoxy-alpha-D-glucopyranoside deacetylase
LFRFWLAGVSARPDPPRGRAALRLQAGRCAADEHAVAARLTGVLGAVEPDVVLTLDGSDGHRDHLRVRIATTVATAGYGAATGRSVRIYESSLPNSLMRAWLDEMRSVRPDTAYHAIDPASIGRPDAEITDVADRSDVLAVRERAIALHASQASPFDGLSPELRRAFLSVDHLVRVA